MPIKTHPECKPHAFQDAKYGDKRRVVNETKKSNAADPPKYRCTVCGQVIK